MIELVPGPRRGTVAAPPSKSHEHRLLVADFLAGDRSRLVASPDDSADIAATKRCLAALATDDATPVLDCGESGSTLRFLMPVAAALGKRPVYRKAGRLAERPVVEYPTIGSGVHELSGGVSSQFVTGLLFALPLLEGDSEIRFTSPLESRGYVDMTLAVLRGAGIKVVETEGGYRVPGSQKYRPQPNVAVEGDWSGATSWLAMNALGSDIKVTGLAADSAQPDRAVTGILARLSLGTGPDFLGTGPVRSLGTGPVEVSVSQCPDLFPAISVVAAGMPRETRFTGIRRLRIKECDRVAAMEETLGKLGVKTTVTEDGFVVKGTGLKFRGGEFRSFGDHRIAMAAAVAATRASSPVVIDDESCAAKSYPSFFAEFCGLPL